MDAFRRRRLEVRRNLHLGVGFLAATSGMTEPGRLRFEVRARRLRAISILEAGPGEPVLCLHGLGGTKASFLPTVGALADRDRVIARSAGLRRVGQADLGPLQRRILRTRGRLAPRQPRDRASGRGRQQHGRSGGDRGRPSLPRPRGEGRLLSPAFAWLRDRPWRWLLQAPVSKLGMLQRTPRGPWSRSSAGSSPEAPTAGRGRVDEFLRSYLTPRGRAAFYAAGRNTWGDAAERRQWILDPPFRAQPRIPMFVWGRHDGLVPIEFWTDVERALPAARHVELDCGHVPQMERPRETHAVIRDFLG